MVNNRLELVRDNRPVALLTWHLPDGNGHFVALAFQFAEDLGDEAKTHILEAAKRPQKVGNDPGGKKALFGTSEHFLALPRSLQRLGYRTRLFGAVGWAHELDGRPLEGA